MPIISLVGCNAIGKTTAAKHTKARCEKKGKRFRDDCWTEYKLNYEASRRYVNYCRGNLHPNQLAFFTIEDQARDWPKVDEYFFKVYARLHNELNRRRRQK